MASPTSRGRPHQFHLGHDDSFDSADEDSAGPGHQWDPNSWPSCTKRWSGSRLRWLTAILTFAILCVGLLSLKKLSETAQAQALPTTLPTQDTVPTNYLAIPTNWTWPPACVSHAASPPADDHQGSNGSLADDNQTRSTEHGWVSIPAAMEHAWFAQALHAPPTSPTSPVWWKATTSPEESKAGTTLVGRQIIFSVAETILSQTNASVLISDRLYKSLIVDGHGHGCFYDTMLVEMWCESSFEDISMVRQLLPISDAVWDILQTRQWPQGLTGLHVWH